MECSPDRVVMGYVYSNAQDRDENLTDLVSNLFRLKGYGLHSIMQDTMYSFQLIFNSRSEAMGAITDIYDEFGKTNYLTVGEKTVMTFESQVFSVKHSIIISIDKPNEVKVDDLECLVERCMKEMDANKKDEGESKYHLVRRKLNLEWMLFLASGSTKSSFLNFIRKRGTSGSSSANTLNFVGLQFKSVHSAKKGRKRKRLSCPSARKRGVRKAMDKSLKEMTSVEEEAKLLLNDIQDEDENSDVDINRIRSKNDNLSKRLTQTMSRKNVTTAIPISNDPQYVDHFRRTREKIIWLKDQAQSKIGELNQEICNYERELASAIKICQRTSQSALQMELPFVVKKELEKQLKNLLENAETDQDRITTVCAWYNEPLIWTVRNNQGNDEIPETNAFLSMALRNLHPDCLPRSIKENPTSSYRTDIARRFLTKIQFKLQTKPNET